MLTQQHAPPPARHLGLQNAQCAPALCVIPHPSHLVLQLAVSIAAPACKPLLTHSYLGGVMDLLALPTQCQVTLPVPVGQRQHANQRM